MMNVLAGGQGISPLMSDRGSREVPDGSDLLMPGSGEGMRLFFVPVLAL